MQMTKVPSLQSLFCSECASDPYYVISCDNCHLVYCEVCGQQRWCKCRCIPTLWSILLLFLLWLHVALRYWIAIALIAKERIMTTLCNSCRDEMKRLHNCVSVNSWKRRRISHQLMRDHVTSLFPFQKCTEKEASKTTSYKKWIASLWTSFVTETISKSLYLYKPNSRHSRGRVDIAKSSRCSAVIHACPLWTLVTHY